MAQENLSLAQSLPLEITRVRDRVLPVYQRRGDHNMARSIQLLLGWAQQAIADKDIFKMLSLNEQLKAYGR